MEKKEIGIINEIGDLGLGFEPVTEESAEIIRGKLENNEEFDY